jgi:hypothetical protein
MNTKRGLFYLKKWTVDFLLAGIVTTLERRYGHQIGMNVATALCLGGNDFVPKLHGCSHSKVLQQIVKLGILPSLVSYTVDQSGKRISGTMHQDVYLYIVKSLYCPPEYDPQLLSLDQVRQSTVRNPKKKKQACNNPQLWTPPVGALLRVLDTINWQIRYLFTAGHHQSILPEFTGQDLFNDMEEGPVWRVDEAEELLIIPEEELRQAFARARIKKTATTKTKRTHEDTPQKGRRRKIRAIAFTQPVSCNIYSNLMTLLCRGVSDLCQYLYKQFNSIQIQMIF